MWFVTYPTFLVNETIVIILDQRWKRIDQMVTYSHSVVPGGFEVKS